MPPQQLIVSNLIKRKLTEENQDPIEKSNHVELFELPSSIFKDFPINDTFVETSEHNCIATEAETSDQFSFIKSKVTGGLINLSTCYLSAKLKIKNGVNNFNDGMCINYSSYLLNTWAKQIQLSVSGVNIGIAHSFNQEISYLLKLLHGNVNMQNNLNGMTLGYPDTPGQFETLLAADTASTAELANKGSIKKLAKLAVSAEVYVMEEIMYPLLSDGNQYIPSANELKLEWTKASNKIFMASEYNISGNNSSYRLTTVG